MYYFDIIIAIILIYAIYKGYTKGLIIQLASLAALILGVWGAIKLSHLASVYLQQWFEINPKYLPVISFALVFFIILILIFMLSHLLQKIIESISLGFLNRIAGVIFSLAKVILILSIIMIYFNRINNKFNILSEKEKEKSIFYTPLSKIAPSIFPYLNFENQNNMVPPSEDIKKSGKYDIKI
jgi:membrane protein required for colicin V production